MKLRVLAWVCCLGLILGVAALLVLRTQQQAQIARLQQENQELQSARDQVEADKAAAAQSQSEELARLRKENEELLKLRNEVRQLRDERLRLGKEVQTAQVQVQQAQTQARNAEVQAQSLRASALAAQAQQATQAAGLTPEQAAFANRYGLTPGQPLSQQDMLNGCVNFLRQIDGAKQQWALENRKTADSVPTAKDLAPYLRINAIPSCPAGGTYTLNSVAQNPVCSIPGHVLPK